MRCRVCKGKGRITKTFQRKGAPRSVVSMTCPICLGIDWPKKKNPLTRAEVAYLRKWAGRVAKDSRYSPAHRATYLGVASGLLDAACNLASGHKAQRWGACRAAAKMLGRSYRAKNPLLQVVLPNRRGRRNPHPRGRNPKVRSDQRISVGGFVSRAFAATYPGFQKALVVHRKFHGREPVHFTRLRIEDGQKHVTRRALVMIGEVPSLEYRTWKHANSVKSFTRDGRRITWKHKMGEHGGRPPYAMHDPQSGITELVGGTYRIAGRPAFYHN